MYESLRSLLTLTFSQTEILVCQSGFPALPSRCAVDACLSPTKRNTGEANLWILFSDLSNEKEFWPLSFHPFLLFRCLEAFDPATLRLRVLLASVHMGEVHMGEVPRWGHTAKAEVPWHLRVASLEFLHDFQPSSLWNSQPKMAGDIWLDLRLLGIETNSKYNLEITIFHLCFDLPWSKALQLDPRDAPGSSGAQYTQTTMKIKLKYASTLNETPKEKSLKWRKRSLEKKPCQKIHDWKHWKH